MIRHRGFGSLWAVGGVAGVVAGSSAAAVVLGFNRQRNRLYLKFALNIFGS